MLTFSINKKAEDCMNRLCAMNLKCDTAYGMEWLGTLIINTVNGMLEDEDVDVNAYGYGCHTNILKATSKREVSMVSVEDSADGFSGVVDIVASYVDTNLEDIIVRADVKAFISDFCEMRERIAINEGIDIWRLINISRMNIDRGGARLRQLAEQYSLKEMLLELLSTPFYMKSLECALA